MGECEHKHTHPMGCDDCLQPWCWLCRTYHEPPIVAQLCVAMRERQSRAEERAAIVAWLRETECTCESLDCPHPSIVCDRAAAIRIADAIERGDYRRGKP